MTKIDIAAEGGPGGVSSLMMSQRAWPYSQLMKDLTLRAELPAWTAAQASAIPGT